MALQLKEAEHLPVKRIFNVNDISYDSADWQWFKKDDLFFVIFL